jgi:thiosulfate reductase cytochrome b subunit
MSDRQKPSRPAHPVPIRVMHWIGVYAMGCMIFSGWEIYNASPDLPFVFPRWAGLGGWLGGALAWHLTAMWVLCIDGLAYLAYGFVSGHFGEDLRPPSIGAFVRDLHAALRFRLTHRLGHYNAVQRGLYVGVLAAVVVQVATGFAIWKPVQLGWLAAAFGGYPLARHIHLAIMLAIVAFAIVHVTLVVIHPSTLKAMIVAAPRESEEQS